MSGEMQSLQLDDGILPIGTVLLINSFDQPIMIFGRHQEQTDTKKIGTM